MHDKWFLFLILFLTFLLFKKFWLFYNSEHLIFIIAKYIIFVCLLPLLLSVYFTLFSNLSIFSFVAIKIKVHKPLYSHSLIVLKYSINSKSSIFFMYLKVYRLWFRRTHALQASYCLHLYYSSNFTAPSFLHFISIIFKSFCWTCIPAVRLTTLCC